MMKWTACLPEYRDLLDGYLAGRVRPEIIKESKHRVVHRISQGDRALYVKTFLSNSVAARLRSWVRDRAAHEYRILQHLVSKKVGAARPVAHGRDDSGSIVVTEEVPGGRPLHDVFTPAHLPALARLVRAVHDAGLRHDDLHIGNVLVNGEGLHLIDVHEASLRRVSAAERVEGVAFVLHSIYTRISLARAHSFIQGYEGKQSPEFVRRVWDAFQGVRQTYWKDRTGRCLRESGEFSVDGPWHLRKPFTRPQAERLLAAAGRTVKQVKNRRLRVVDDRFIKSGPRAIEQWTNGRGLEVRHLPTPKLWAARPGEVIGEWRPTAEPLWDYIRTAFPRWSRRERNDFLHRLARQIRRLHLRGVFHHDLKANNVLVDETGFWFIDLDRVTFRREIGERERLFNLAQLNAAIGAPLTRGERLRGYRYYAGNNRAWRMGWKSRVRKIMKSTVARKHHWP